MLTFPKWCHSHSNASVPDDPPLPQKCGDMHCDLADCKYLACMVHLGENVLVADYRGFGDSGHMHPVLLFISSYWLLYLELYELFICLINVCI